MKIWHKNQPLEVQAGVVGLDLLQQLKLKNILGLSNQGELQDLNQPLKEGDRVEFLTFEDPLGKYLFWHTSAHVLAQAVLRLFPAAQPTIGPPIENGFYYDFFNLSIKEADFESIEKEMQNIIAADYQPERIEYENEQAALEQFAGNPFKIELIKKFQTGLSAYKQGEFLDLCRGPHLTRVGLIKALKITKTAGAYWQGKAENPQLTRIYGLAYPSPKELRQYLNYLEQVKLRDHRLWGQKLNLFSFQKEAPGMPFFHPKGMVLWDELLKFWRECHKEDYAEVKTPTMMRRELWESSGHWEHYHENMYFSTVDEQEYAIKPMNCPGCLLYYKSQQFSYRQLPLRIAEIGNVHRHELSGVLSGLFRVRCFHQDDAHLFITEAQIKTEILAVLKLADRLYSQFGLSYRLELSTRPEKSIGTDQQWEITTNALEEALKVSGQDYKINAGDGSFYGPKIDLQIKDALGREWQCGTIQLDMLMPERFGLLYDAEDGSKKRPVMIHRALYGSMERFFGIVLEHFSGKLPLWLSPEQLRVLTLADRHQEYAKKVQQALKDKGFRAEADLSQESLNKKVRSAQIDQVNYILVVGDQEQENNTVNLRTRSQYRAGNQNLEQLITALEQEYQNRESEPAFKAD